MQSPNKGLLITSEPLQSIAHAEPPPLSTLVEAADGRCRIHAGEGLHRDAMLSMNNSAFYYFMLTTLTIYLLPATTASPTTSASAPLPKLDAAAAGGAHEPRAEEGGADRGGALGEQEALQDLVLRVRVLHDRDVAALWPSSARLQRHRDHVVRPVQDLPEIERGVEDAEIKSAYRNGALAAPARRGRPPASRGSSDESLLSRARRASRYHPDKNQGNKLAEEMFTATATRIKPPPPRPRARAAAAAGSALAPIPR